MTRDPLSGLTPNGLLSIDKPQGSTSHDVVDAVRKQFGLRKVGHTGTLDPLATGVLVLCLGRATRLSAYLTGLDKRYTATVRFGSRTDTMDSEGDVTETSTTVPDGMKEVVDVLTSLTGKIDQLSPMFSARKVRGKKLYELARQGETNVDRPVRKVTVYEVKARSYHPPDLHLDVHCSTGTYIRVLADDLGDRLGCFGHITALRRTAVGGIDIDSCRTLDDLETLHDQGGSRALLETLVDPGEALGHLPVLELNGKPLQTFRHGNPVPGISPSGDGGELVRAYDPQGILVGIGRWAEDRTALQPVRVLHPAEG